MENASISERHCGTCTMCCKLVEVREFAKPIQKWCPYCTIGVGCKIYDKRPKECADFKCLWLYDDRLDVSFRPDISKCVIYYQKAPDDQSRGFMMVEMGMGDRAYIKNNKYLSIFKSYASMLEPSGGCVVVHFTNYMYVVTIDNVFDLGPIRQEKSFNITYDFSRGRIFDITLCDRREL